MRVSFPNYLFKHVENINEPGYKKRMVSQQVAIHQHDWSIFEIRYRLGLQLSFSVLEI